MGANGETRLIHLAEYAPAHGGSFIPMVRSVVSEAARRGWKAEVVFPAEAEGRDWIDSFRELDVPLRLSPPQSRRSLARWIGEVLDEQDLPTVVHTHFTTYDVPAVMAASSRSRTRVLWHTHSVLMTSRRVAAANMLKNAIFGRRVDRILCPAQNIADAMARRLAPRAKLEVFPSPIEISRFPMLDTGGRDRARQALDLPQEATVLLHFGRDWNIKAGDVFMASVRQVVDRNGGQIVALVHHGGSPAVNDAARLGLSDSLRNVGTVDDVQDLFGAADVFVAPSRGEGMPFSVIESVCTGTPVVASDLPGHRFLPDGFEACRVVPMDPDRVAAAIQEVLREGRRRSIDECAKAREWIGENLDLAAATERLIGLYERMAAEVRSTGGAR